MLGKGTHTYSTYTVHVCTVCHHVAILYDFIFYLCQRCIALWWCFCLLTFSAVVKVLWNLGQTSNIRHQFHFFFFFFFCPHVIKFHRCRISIWASCYVIPHLHESHFPNQSDLKVWCKFQHLMRSILIICWTEQVSHSWLHFSKTFWPSFFIWLQFLLDNRKKRVMREREEMKLRRNRRQEEEVRRGGGRGRRRGRGRGCGRFFTWRQKQAEEPLGSAGNGRARPSSRKALSALIHYSAMSTISLCQAIFTRSDKIDSMYKRMCNAHSSTAAAAPQPLPPAAPPPAHHHLFIYLAR